MRQLTTNTICKCGSGLPALECSAGHTFCHSCCCQISRTTMNCPTCGKEVVFRNAADMALGGNYRSNFSQDRVGEARGQSLERQEP